MNNAAQTTSGHWQIGYSDGSGNSPDSGFSIVENDRAIVRSGDSFGLVYGITDRTIAERIVRACNGYDAMVSALEKISGQRDYDPNDHNKAALHKPSEGMWTTDEYLADAALAGAT